MDFWKHMQDFLTEGTCCHFCKCLCWHSILSIFPLMLSILSTQWTSTWPRQSGLKTESRRDGVKIFKKLPSTNYKCRARRRALVLSHVMPWLELALVSFRSRNSTFMADRHIYFQQHLQPRGELNPPRAQAGLYMHGTAPQDAERRHLDLKMPLRWPILSGWDLGENQSPGVRSCL